MTAGATDHPQIRRPEGLKVTYRRMKFPFEDGFPRYWFAERPFVSLFWSQLSTAFEPGEKFFIDSARALKDQIKDPALLEEIAEFCRQEGHHTAQHIKFDRMNEAHGLDVKGCRDRYAWVLNRARNNMDPMEMLAATCALEHFTSGFAEQYFGKPHLSEGADPGVTALWAWHAAEELEHKATCYDIYDQLGGKYHKRVTVMIGAWFLILAVALINTHILLWRDKQLFSRDTLKGYWYLFGKGGLLSGMVPGFLRYFLPRFHPWQHNNVADLRNWEAGNKQYIVNSRGSIAPPPAAA
jgi:predicted metal-dependent hydrolase